MVIEHVEENNEPTVNSNFDSFYEEDVESSDDDSMKQIFLTIGIISALGSMDKAAKCEYAPYVP